MRQFSFNLRKIPYKNPNLESYFRSKQIKGNWWTPIWKGLVIDKDSKHRKAMGAAVWLYLYLLTYTNRTTGIFRKNLPTIHQETGYPVRTIQRHLKRLSEKGYITVLDSTHAPKIRIEKWKLFNGSQINDK
ncbi:MAG: helix-turn-helix domain-containing protein [Acidobacteria bacterium]|nr:helix-turn-helix domain-containing protein [Acidobacteriota bacterium]